MALRLALLLAALLFASPALATPRVIASILPLHSLVAQVMEGLGTPLLLLPAGASPHGYALRPSEARALGKAELVVLVGGGLESFLERPHSALAGGAAVLKLAEVPGMRLLPPAEAEDHEHAEGELAGEGQHVDPHLWLDPANGARALAAIAERLATLDPAQAAHYRANAERGRKRLLALDRDLRIRLAPLAGRPYGVFHPAFRYFETAYGLSSLGAVALDPERPSGAQHLLELRRRLQEAGALCLFLEPQFEPRLAKALVEGSRTRLAVLDPLGADLTPGREAYEALLGRMAEAFLSCLS